MLERVEVSIETIRSRFEKQVYLTEFEVSYDAFLVELLRPRVPRRNSSGRAAWAVRQRSAIHSSKCRSDS